jgi:hypothetical protein
MEPMAVRRGASLWPPARTFPPVRPTLLLVNEIFTKPVED